MLGSLPLQYITFGGEDTLSAICMALGLLLLCLFGCSGFRCVYMYSSHALFPSKHIPSFDHLSRATNISPHCPPSNDFPLSP